MLTVNNISYEKNQQKILSNIGFTIGLGSALMLVGKNGIGKSTLLKIISGLISPTSGEILWNNIPISEFYPEYSGDIQYIGHKNFLKNKLTVTQNLEFYSCLSNTQILIPAALHYFGLKHLANIPIAKLSSGWQQRVILAKLFCCPATIWLLDEPSNNLDKIGKELLFNMISVRIKEGGIVLIATHDESLFSLGSKLYLEDFYEQSL